MRGIGSSSWQIEELVGARLGPYQIEEVLGAGGMGVVYRARDTRLNRNVALKVLLPDRLASPDLRARFQQEAQAVSALNHPNIVTLYDISSDQGMDFLVMEYVPGRTLKELIPPEGLPLVDVIHYGVQVAQALDAAHASRLVHRDIKPANIMVTADARVKVLDFGLAKLLDRISAEDETRTLAEAQTTPGSVMGTVFYMSPEQARGEALDGRSDIFSLGTVLYEAATGTRPFRGPSTLSVLHAIATLDPADPSALRAGLPRELDRLLQRALSKDKACRHATGLEFAEALQSLRDPVTSRALPAVATEREPETFVGREPEMQKLEQSLQKALQGSGTIVFLTGAAGMGKSALAAAFLRRLRRDCPEVLAGRGACVEHFGAGEAYLPFLDALSGWLNGSARERVMGVLRRHAPTWCLQFPTTYDDTDSIEQLQREAIGANKERMLREFGDALGALASAAPIVLQLEDLHWSDPPSIDLLRYIGSRFSGHRLLLIGTVRGAETERSDHPLKNCMREMRAHNLCEEIVLQPLGREHIGDYLDRRFDPHDLPVELTGLIHRKTEGHPLFLAALVQLLAERGDIAKSDDRWKLARPLDELALEAPESVRGLIRKKIDALDEADRRALQYASVEGEEFTSTILAALLATDELELEERLARLGQLHGLIETQGEEELPDGTLSTRYRFGHALYQNILYGDLLSKQRTLLHRRAGEQLARYYGEETGKIASTLAVHFERGRDSARAIEYLTQAAEVAMERYAGAAAEQDYSHALQLAGKMPSAERARTEIRLFEKRGRDRLALGRLPEAEEDFVAMLEQARAAGDPEHECRALNALANPFLTVRSIGIGQMDEGAWQASSGSLNADRIETMSGRARRALELAERMENPALRAEAMVNLALRHSVAGEPAMARSLFDAAIPIARAAGHHHALLTTLTYRGVGHFFQTEFGPAEEMLHEAADLASRLRDGVMLRTAKFFLGWTRGSLGKISDALAVLSELKEMSERNGDALFRDSALRRMRWVRAELGDHQPAMPDDEASGKDRLPRPAYDTGGFSGVRLQAKEADASLARGDLERARELGRALLENSTRHGPPKYVVAAHRILAEVATATGKLSEAEAELAAAIEILRTNPAPLVAWKIYALLGGVYRLKDDNQAAQEALHQAEAIIEQIASNIADDQLRSTFLNSPAVQQVLSRKTS
jgi:tetratricopeptide (TPR) repeat protein/predicted Ser/Thr protein kinase